MARHDIFNSIQWKKLSPTKIILILTLFFNPDQVNQESEINLYSDRAAPLKEKYESMYKEESYLPKPSDLIPYVRKAQESNDLNIPTLTPMQQVMFKNRNENPEIMLKGFLKFYQSNNIPDIRSGSTINYNTIAWDIMKNKRLTLKQNRQAIHEIVRRQVKN